MQVNGPYLQVVGTSKIHATRLPSILYVVLLSFFVIHISQQNPSAWCHNFNSTYATSDNFRLRIGISSLSFNIKTQQPELFVCGLRSLTVVNILHGKYNLTPGEWEGMSFYSEDITLEKEKHLLPSAQSVAFLCVGLLLIILVQEGIFPVYSFSGFST